MTQITLDQLNAMDRGGFVAALGDVFEHTPWVAETAFASRPFASLDALYDTMTAAVRQGGAEPQIALIKGHPDLAGKAAREGAITDNSKREQSSAGLDQLSDEEFAAFHRLNDAYHKKFGIPFIVCVRRHGKESILRQFARRLQHDAATERDAALAEIFRIVALRLAQRVSAPDQLKVHGLAVNPCARHPSRLAGVGRSDRALRSRFVRRNTADHTRGHQRGRPHRSAADRQRADPDRRIRVAL